ncbi:bifunctional phosphoribosyl-AMP cyclohydrolase/phosphoribosyl-ATP diphosphatase HisIE [Photobacterium sp. TY1-4]|uniref:bifunctional phosphoribosyl-AMP cyclohydrolase/phosphoribosyl-ATP diphosphatase HisIE n=1 Tax=Photobacterium sp. TY1-4 TaxID=2899122 RepID=UPI0021BFF73C|nr:bifunctional phosphoribosyl-AMP cyclohydrolase/phosphoribosyl-ATP diphosphatase HisIE [Photobacterium sp. TY1-4]UXI02118.1 bifunctional phosphoribosyl-AMP cyclohydrolase/phosphoribosyl-ATP diphosphatase HisIE [Photobacterium sp. TY1-4]
MNQTTNINWEKVGGLIPAVIQDATSGQVLMLGYMNDEALAKTLETRQVTFWSRSKNRLWTKGESSGNVLQLDSIRVDCDQDTLLVTATPVGPTCHLGTPTCFDTNAPLTGNGTQPALVFLHQLEQVLAERKHADPDSSYTASLYARGTKRISQKVGEEGVEVALAATSGDKAELVCESADLLYHLIVLLQDQGLSLSDVMAKLQERHQ